MAVTALASSNDPKCILSFLKLSLVTLSSSSESDISINRDLLRVCCRQSRLYTVALLSEINQIVLYCLINVVACLELNSEDYCLCKNNFKNNKLLKR